MAEHQAGVFGRRFFFVDVAMSRHQNALSLTDEADLMFGIREQALELLEGGNYTATAIAGKLGVDRNAVSHAVLRSYRAGECRIVDYIRTGKDLAPVYGLGGGDDVERPTPLDPNDRSAAYRARNPDANRASSRAWRERNLEKVLAKQAAYRARRRGEAAAASPVASAESRPQTSVLPPPRKPAVTETVLQYFELDGGLLPGVQHFVCDRYKATLSVESCADKFKQANSGDAFGRHAHCRLCPIGAQHAGAGVNLNLGELKGSLTCSRCHRTNGRLIAKRLCISCANRQYEYIKGRNAKGSRPVTHPSLHRLTIGYRAGEAIETHTVERAVDTTELIVDVLRDSKHIPSFGWLASPAMRALRDNPDLDFSIGDEPIVEEMPGAYAVENDPQAAAPAMDDAVDVACAGEPVMNESDALPADPYGAMRAALEQIERDVPVSIPTGSRRAAKRAKQQQRRQVRVSAVTVDLLRRVGALPALAPVVVPAWQSSSSYSASLMSGGQAGG